MWSVRVRATGRDRATAYVRRHRFEIGAPVHFDAEADAISAVEYTLSALAADLVNGFVALARRRRLAVDAVEAVVTGELNNPHPGMERITVKVYVTSGASEGDVERVWSDALELSPLARTLRDAVNLRIELRVEP
jgi:uncharacterized OsmC-like protein